MSETQRYLIQKTPIGTMMKPNPGGNWVAFEDFDRLTAERDALQNEVGQVKGEYDRAANKVDALQALLTAEDEELDRCRSMALMIEEREWAEHVGAGPISSRVESEFTQMHNELSEARQGLTAADERADVLEGLLRLARQFVTNGVELGYITMPDPETPDAAHDLVPMIDAALKP